MADNYNVAVVSPGNFGCKIAITNENDCLIECEEFNNERIDYMMDYFTLHKKSYDGLHLVGCSNDPWPISLLEKFDKAGHTPSWLNSSLVDEILRYSAPWNFMRKFHHFKTLAHIYRLDKENSILPSPKIIVREWERKVAMEIVEKCNFY